MYQQEELISIFEETERLCNEGYFSTKLENKKHYIPEIIALPTINEVKRSGNVIVKNIGCIAEGKELSQQGKTCMLNMASHTRPGGGVRTGRMSQEEELARCSNLMFGLNPKDYPLGDDQFIYTHNVTFFRGDYYAVMQPFHVDVITIPALNIREGIPNDYEAVMMRKIEAMLLHPHKNKCENLILSAFGCGVFANDPTRVATMFDQVLNSGWKDLYENIVFAIYNDQNSVGKNYEIFKEILNP